jgi:acetyltransferase-like isoleucine patch superfamily enzyme
MNFFKTLLTKIRTLVVLRHQLFSLGIHSSIVWPARIDGAKNMEIGSGTFIQRGSWLYARSVDRSDVYLKIGRNCIFGYNIHIASVRSVVIGDNVLTANNVFITDNTHSYRDVDRPIIEQPVVFSGSVEVGSGSWLGENVCILSSNIGRNSVIGANSVVTRDVPDYCVAVGAPAIIIKHYNRDSCTWDEGPPAGYKEAAR